MGGLGVMLTALAIAQAESPFLSVSVVLPFYSFLRTDSSPSYNISHFAEIRVPIAGNRGKTPKLVGCVVSLLRWEYESATDFLNPPSLSRNGNGDRTETTRRSIDIYLIGPGDQKPFNIAFKAKDAGDVYSAYKPLKQEWKDLWFAKASAELLTFLGYDGSRPYQNPIDTEAADDDEEGWELELQDANGDDDATVFVTSRTAGVDVVHLHGATNAMVGYFLRETERVERYDRTTTPAIVYTLHDSLDEVEYSNLVSNSLAFLDSPLLAPRFLEEMSDYIIEDRQLFASAVGIDVADAVTFVSRAIAQDIVEGRFRFALRDLVMPSIARKAKDGRFVGITNGLDFTDQAKNPFTSPVLVERGLAFPRVGTNVTDSSTFPSSPSPYSTTASSFAHTKLLAKQHLVSHLPSHFNFGPLDATRPYLLFIGRYQYNKGCQFFEPILRHLSSSSPLSSSGRLILLGARNNYPHSLLLRLASLYPNHLTLIDTIEDQREWGTIIRMASDFALVPSFSEAFGLVAAEGMLFGMSVYVRVYDLALTSRRGPSLIPLPHPISLSLPPLLSHPVAAPSIAHGGHDRVTGKEGVEALAQVAANVKPILPVFKVKSRCGIIQTVRLQDFMSHKLSEFEFGPHMNFLVGKRFPFSSLLAFDAFAVCSVKLSNTGPDAYESATYGDSLTIERRITLGGGGGYKIKDVDGITIDSRKSTVDRILDHFDIELDNPLVVLTQTLAKTFLAKSTDVEKYQFFLKGSRLYTLSENYKSLLFTIDLLKLNIGRKKVIRQELVADLAEAVQNAEDATADLDRETNRYNAVMAKDDEVDTAVRESEVERDEIAQDIEVIERAVHDMETEKASKAAEMETLRGKIRTHADGLRALKRDGDVIKRDTRQMEDDIAATEAAIAAVKNDRRGGLDRQPILDELEQLEAKLESIQASFSFISFVLLASLTARCAQVSMDRSRQDSKDAEEAQRALSLEEGVAAGRLKEAKGKVSRIEARLSDLQNSRKDKLNAYGNNVPKLADLVKKESSWRGTVFGPVGTFISVRHSQYASVIETVLGGSLETWIVDNPRDKETFSRLQKQAYNRATVALWRYDPNFDCRAGEPDKSILTILRALEFKAVDKDDLRGEIARQYLVTGSKIEGRALVERRVDGDKLMRSNPRNVSAAFDVGCFQVTGSSVGLELSAAQAEVRQHQDSVDRIRQRLNESKTKLVAANKRRNQLAMERPAIETRRQLLFGQLEEEAPTNLAALQDQLDTSINELQALKAQTVAFDEGLATPELEKAGRRVAAAEKAKAAHEAELAERLTDIKDYEEKLAERKDIAAQVCAQRPEGTDWKSPTLLKKEIVALEKAIREYSREAGQTPDEIVATRDRLKKTVAEAKNASLTFC
ncbi:hypothetical protein RQP46_005151 [Phenoliferia psychrophenolica]